MLLVKTLVKTYNKKTKNIVIVAIKSKNKQESEQFYATSLYNSLKMFSIMKLIKKMTKTQVITVPATVTQTPGGINS